jgi:hypothetical protein
LRQLIPPHQAGLHAPKPEIGLEMIRQVSPSLVQI